MLEELIEPSVPFTEQDILRMEKILGRKLPEDYLTFVKKYGGAFIGGEFERPEEPSILGLFEADEYQGENSLFETYDDFREIGALPFARCDFGNIYVLTEEDEVYYIDYTGGETSSLKIAISFSDFLSRIVASPEDDLEE